MYKYEYLKYTYKELNKYSKSTKYKIEKNTKVQKLYRYKNKTKKIKKCPSAAAVRSGVT